MSRRLFLLSVLYFGVFSGLAQAQSLGAEPLSIGIEPEYPVPYATVSISPESNLINLAAAKITISVNGTVIREGSGSESVTTKVGGPGEATTIRVTVTGPEGTFQKVRVIRPADVALVTDALSTSHPFYKGASLVPSEGRVRFIAVPDFRTSTGARINPATLSYAWKVGSRNLLAESGIGKNVLTAQAPVRYRDSTVTVHISTPDGAMSSEESTVVSPVDPQLILYRNAPLFGPDFSNAVPSSVMMEGEEDTYRAVSYYFPSVPSLLWTMNGASMGTDQDITVRTTGSSAGTAILTAEATGLSAFQSAKDSVSVKYGATQSSTLFGI